jgi:hypothetical protein
MAWTKRDLISQAFAEIGMAEYVFDLLPEQWEGGLKRLDAMMAQWNAKGIRIGYPLPSSYAASSLDQDSEVPDMALEAVYLNLAVRLAPQYGKTVSPDTKIQASTDYKTQLSISAVPIPMRINTNMVPAGAAYKMTVQTSLPTPENPIDAGPDSELDFS